MEIAWFICGAITTRSSSYDDCSYTGKEQCICTACWQQVPPKVRREYWRLTDYGNLDPSDQAKELILNTINSR